MALPGAEKRATGITLKLLLPNGTVEAVSVYPTDPGQRVISLLAPIRQLHRLPREVQLLRADGKALEPNEQLQAQDLQNGSELRVEVPQASKASVRVSETVVVGPEELKQKEEELSDPLSLRREVREERACTLKDKGNELLKEEKFGLALEMYTLAISWLPPADSDSVLAAALFGNRALAHLKLKDWRSARDDAEQCLVLQPGNLKVRFRLGTALRELGDLDAAHAAFRAAAELDPQDKAVRAALAATENELKAREKKAALSPPPEVPECLRWRAAELQRGLALPRIAAVWRSLKEPLEASLASALRHALRCQPPLQRFFRACLHAADGPVLLLGAGSLAAAAACSEFASERGLTAVLAEPCELLRAFCEGLYPEAIATLSSEGQISNEFALPAAAFEKLYEALATRAAASPSVFLVCDRLADDLLGEGLVATMAAGRQAAAKNLPPGTALRCIPARAELRCALLELRCGEVGGFDTSKANALRFTAHPEPEEEVPPGARNWKCSSCSWSNCPVMKGCEMCRAPKQGQSSSASGVASRPSTGWWPHDLDVEATRTSICRLCSKEQVLLSLDFDDPAALSLLQRRDRLRAEFLVTGDGRINAVATWWRLQGPGGAQVTSRPMLASGAEEEGCEEVWTSRRQAVYYLGFEVGVEEGEKLLFDVELKDNLSRLKFDLVAPKLPDRMGLMKFDLPILNLGVARKLQEKLDVKTNRLLATIPNTPLKRRDKMLKFGPFDIRPGTFEPQHWRFLEERIRQHTERPRPGDVPVTCVFSRGAFEGTLRWPEPVLAIGSVVPRLPSYFLAYEAGQLAMYQEALVQAVGQLELPHVVSPRVLEIGCSAVPFLSLVAARHGCRAWAVEMIPQLRDLAVETVRDHDLEMVSQYKGLSSFSFFGHPRRPEDPSVRVMAAGPSTSLQVGITPKLLDGSRAHLVACMPDPGLIGEEYLETMWHAAEELLEDCGVLLPGALQVFVAGAQCFPFGDGSPATASLHEKLCLGHMIESSLSSNLAMLSEASAAMSIDLRQRHTPAAEGHIEITAAGTLTALVFWWEPVLGLPEVAQPSSPGVVHLCFLRNPVDVTPGERFNFSLGLIQRQLQLSLPS